MMNQFVESRPFALCSSPTHPFGVATSVHPSALVSPRVVSRTASSAALLVAATFAWLVVGCGSSDAGAGAVTPIVPDAGSEDVLDADDQEVTPTPDVVEDVPDVEEEVTPLPDVIDSDAEIEFPPVVVAVETVLSASEVRAGDTVYVTCRGIGYDGEPVMVPEEFTQIVYVTPTTSVDWRGIRTLEFTALRPGIATAACAIPQLGLIDDSPAEVVILPGLVHTMVAELDPYVITAGDFTEVTCTALDELGNTLDVFSYVVRTDPFGDGISVDRDFVEATRAGSYDVFCDTEGTAISVPAELEVVPGLPASATIGLVPSRSVYQIGEVVEIRYTVVDIYGNVIPNAPVSFASLPTVPNFGEGRFRFNEEGIFTLSLIVGIPTHSGSPILVQTDVIVNSEGPDIGCDRPGDGEFFHVAPGEVIEFRGRVQDAFGTDRVTVNGTDATVTPEGLFTASVTTRFGINFVEIVAEDEFGLENSRICTFLAADRWTPDATFLPDSVTLAMAQNALDDGDRSGPINSLNDILHRVLNSPGLRDTLHDALLGANPLVDECVQQVCVFGCICLLRVRVNYENTEIRGPNITSLQLVDGGMRAVATIRGLRVRLRIGGTFSTNGWVTIDSISVDLTFNMGLEGGRPRVSVRSINNVSVGSVSTSFSGITGAVINVVVRIFNGPIRNLIRDQVRNFIRDNFNEVLDGVVSGLNIDSLGSSFEVPRLDGSGNIRLGFGIQFSSLNANPTRALFGIGTRFSGDVNRDGVTLGAPIPPGTIRPEPSGARTMTATVAIGLLNQALHTLWRGGMFDASLSADIVGTGGDAIAVIRTDLPPVAAGSGHNEIRLMLGAMRASIVIPGVIDAPIQVQIGAVASSGFDLLPGDIIRFRDIVIEELYFSPERALDPAQRVILEDFIRDIVQFVVDDSLNSALPVLPIPDFALPDSLSSFGIAPGTRLGITSPIIQNNSTHFVVEGNFGER